MRSRALSVLTLIATIAAANAPADQYFGKLKMSTLRIRYETMQLRKRYETHQLLPDQAAHLLDSTADAFTAWAAAYPHDQWLASTGFLLAQLYAELPGPAARSHAVVLFTYVSAHFRATRYGAQSRTALHRGIPVRPAPAWATVTAQPSAPGVTPAPSIAPSPAKTP